ISVSFTNEGTLSVLSGHTQFSAPGRLVQVFGEFSIEQGAVATVQTFDMQDGTVRGDGLLEITGMMSWTGGSMTSTTTMGETVFKAVAQVQINGAVRTDTRFFVNDGTVQYIGGNILFDDTTFTNNGTFDVQEDVDLDDDGGSTFGNL